MKFTERELRLIGTLSRKDEWKDVEITRKSDREGDLQIEGEDANGKFGAWLVLAAIRNANWTGRTIASMTDYPSMARSGDWSGVRDTSEDKLWEIFDNLGS